MTNCAVGVLAESNAESLKATLESLAAEGHDEAIVFAEPDVIELDELGDPVDPYFQRISERLVIQERRQGRYLLPLALERLLAWFPNAEHVMIVVEEPDIRKTFTRDKPEAICRKPKLAAMLVGWLL